MHLRRSSFSPAAAAFLFLSVFLFSTTASAAAGHNITRILDKYPELFSTFNHYLSVTNLASEINQRKTITVCVVDNAAMSVLLEKHLTIAGIKQVLSLHVLLDYFDDKKLHKITNGTALAATAYQATGSAQGSSGFVNITLVGKGGITFSPHDNGGFAPATFVKQVEADPFTISVIQISNILPSPDEQALAPAPASSDVNVTDLMSAHGCKVFADTLLANTAAKSTYYGNVVSGLTVFCPGDDAMKVFLPRYKNLTASGKQALLEFHGIPVYQTLTDLRSSNGLTSTLANDGSSKYAFTVQNDGKDVTIVTKLVKARIVNTVVDESPVAIYELNKVLLPEELFKDLAPAPAPGPDAADAPSPKSKKHKSPPAPAAPSDSPADSPDGEVVDDDSSDGERAVRFSGGVFCAVIAGLWSVFLQI